MSKHIMDRARTAPAGGRTKHYLALQRAEDGGLSVKEQALVKGHSTGRDDGQRMREFARIDRQVVE